MILDEQGKYEEALTELSGEIGRKFYKVEYDRRRKELDYHITLKHWKDVHTLSRELIEQMSVSHHFFLFLFLFDTYFFFFFFFLFQTLRPDDMTLVNIFFNSTTSLVAENAGYHSLPLLENFEIG
jgi:hypothetical protein